jgi:hypothetical protein
MVGFGRRDLALAVIQKLIEHVIFFPRSHSRQRRTSSNLIVLRWWTV